MDGGVDFGFRDLSFNVPWANDVAQRQRSNVPEAGAIAERLPTVS